MVDKSVGKTAGAMADGTVSAGVLMDRCGRHPSRPQRDESGAAIMAGGTVAGDARVVEDGRKKSTSRVASGTILTRRQMACALNQVRRVGEKSSDMTTFATTVNVRMQVAQKSRRHKHIGGIVTGTAIILCRYVIDLLRGCDAGVVAGRAVIGIYTHVAERYARKACEVVDVMAGRAIQGRRQMIDRLADADLTVMASRAVTGIYTRMIERRASKVRGGMTGDAILGGRQVIDELADADNVVVA